MRVMSKAGEMEVHARSPGCFRENWGEEEGCVGLPVRRESWSWAMSLHHPLASGQSAPRAAQASSTATMPAGMCLRDRRSAVLARSIPLTSSERDAHTPCRPPRFDLPPACGTGRTCGRRLHSSACSVSQHRMQGLRVARLAACSRYAPLRRVHLSAWRGRSRAAYQRGLKKGEGSKLPKLGRSVGPVLQIAPAEPLIYWTALSAK